MEQSTVEMKKCDLCKVPARIFCESDQASLCWDCDAKVHGANFLVARHTRTLLCRICRSLTPWKASGATLGNTVSVCERCAAGEEEEAEESEEGDNDDEMVAEDDDFDDVVDEDADNQVVPGSSTPPPPAASSSGSEWSSVSRCNDGNSSGDGDVSDSVSEPVTTTASLKRRREDDASDRDLQEGPNGLTSQRRCGGEWREEVACGGEPPSKEWLRPRGRASDAV